MISYARTDIGRARKVNQDFVYASPEPIGLLPNLFIVADGMGGHKAGDFASRFSVNLMVELAETLNISDPILFLGTAIREVNRRLYKKSKEIPELEGTGTTIVAAVMMSGTMYVANVGDSRLYLFREDLKQITRDHSLVEELVLLGKIERGSEVYKSQKNIITRAVGILADVDVDLFEVSLKEHDCILMCSDGLTNMVEDEEICGVLKTTDTLKEKTDTLICHANENGGRDNISIILTEPQISEVRV